jgi:NAD dependent epimerase/dehydratase family enzyme
LSSVNENANNLTAVGYRALKSNTSGVNNTAIGYHSSLNNVFNIVSIGRENIEEILSELEKKQILNSRYNCLEELVQMIHCKEYDQFKNIIITNLQNKYAYKFDNIHCQSIRHQTTFSRKYCGRHTMTAHK